MKKMNQHLRERLILQAEEAKHIGLVKLGETVQDAVLHAQVVTDTGIFNHDELVESVKGSLWRAACKIAIYHDLPTIDIQKMETLIVVATNDFMHHIECSYDVENKIGPFEEVVMGQTIKPNS